MNRKVINHWDESLLFNGRSILLFKLMSKHNKLMPKYNRPPVLKDEWAQEWWKLTIKWKISIVSPGGSDDKESASNARDLGLISGSGRSLREWNGYPLQNSYLENPMDRRAWPPVVHRVTESRTWLKWLSNLRDFKWTNKVEEMESINLFLHETKMNIF